MEHSISNSNEILRAAATATTDIGRQDASLRLSVGIFEAVARLAALRSVELGRPVGVEEVMEQAILEHLIDAGFVDQCL